MKSSHKEEVEDIIAEVKAKGLLHPGVIHKLLDLLCRMASDLDDLTYSHTKDTGGFLRD